MVLCFSPIGEDFRRRLRNFPAFINNTTINFFLNWPESALEEVAQSHLQTKTFDSHIKKQLSKCFVNMHQTSIKFTEKFY